jgi:hypothetical protein
MKEHCKNRRHPTVVDDGRNERLSPFQRLTIEPPPRETGPEQLFRVVYVIDVNAMNPR